MLGRKLSEREGWGGFGVGRGGGGARQKRSARGANVLESVGGGGGGGVVSNRCGVRRVHAGEVCWRNWGHSRALRLRPKT